MLAQTTYITETPVANIAWEAEIPKALYDTFLRYHTPLRLELNTALNQIAAMAPMVDRKTKFLVGVGIGLGAVGALLGGLALARRR